MITPFRKVLKTLIIAVVLMTAVIIFNVGEKITHARSTTAPPSSRTAAPAFGAVPAEGNCTGCHSTFPLNDPAGGGKVELLDFPTSYVPGQEYTIRVAVSQTGRVKFGFQLTALDPTGNKAGSFANIDTTRTGVSADVTFNGTTRQYIYHAVAPAGTTGNFTDKSEWTMKWTAPASRVGKIGFYATGNATNSSSSNAGDNVYSTSALVTPSVASVSSADYNAANPITSGGAASAFGVELATQTATATDQDTVTPGIQLPTTLGGTTVKVKDSLGTTRDASLFFVSPTQINYLVPAATANGIAEITITNSVQVKSIGNVTIAAVQPGVFSLTGDGAGLPVAQIQRVNGQTQTFEDTFISTGTNTWASVPIEWKNANESLYLVLYGVGIRNNTGLSGVGSTIGGISLSAQFAGAHSAFPGVDQVNILLDRALATKGDVNVVLSVDGKSSNPVKINFK